MAIPFSVSLLLAVLITTAASETPASPSQPPSLQASPPAPSSPSPAPPPGIQEKQLKNILDALVGAGDSGGWGSLLSASNPSALPFTATLFIPDNNAITHFLSAASAPQFDPLIIPYHIVPQRFTFADLQQFTTHTRLPTLLPSKFIVVTNNSPSNFTLDGSRISQPDVFLNAAFALHGIDKILDYSVYGDGDNNGPLSPPPTQAPPAGGKKRPVAPGGLTSGASRPCYQITAVFLSISFWTSFHSRILCNLSIILAYLIVEN